MSRAIGVEGCLDREPTLHRIRPNVLLVLKIIRDASNLMVRKTALPYFELGCYLFPYTMGESPFDVLNCTLNADTGWSNQHMKVFRHECEFVQRVASLRTINVQRFDKHFRHA